MKTCTQCHIEKDESEFYKKSKESDETIKKCKECTSTNQKNYYAANSDKIKAKVKEYYDENQEACHARALAYHFANRDERLIAMSEYFDANKERYSEYAKNYYIENCEKIKADVRANYNANADEINAKTRAERKENPEKFREYDRLQYIANPERFLIKGVNRRARKKGNGGKLSPGLKKKLFKLQRGHCAICKIKLSDAPRQQHMDHTIALANGGPNEDWNMQLLCQPCNNQKHTKDNLEFMQSKGYLI